MITIYALFDPREPLQLRYIGQTKYPLHRRLIAHVSGSKSKFNNTPKDAWIRELLMAGIRPEIRRLSESRYHKSADAAEAKWIHFWSGFCDVLNVQAGGRCHRFLS